MEQTPQPNNVINIKEANASRLEENRKNRVKSKSKTFWEPEFGWLTKNELDKLNKGIKPTNTRDERLRGYRLTESKYKEICEQTSSRNQERSAT
jgi:hypothetical protein